MLLGASSFSSTNDVSILQGVPQYVRFYRDFSVADFTFCTISTLFVTYASFSYYSVRSRICEEISRHGDLMRDLAEAGLSSENCEQWFERAVMVFVGIMFVIIVIRVSEQGFSLQGRELNHSSFWPCIQSAVAPRRRSVKLLQASSPHLKRLSEIAQRRCASAHLPSPQPYRFRHSHGSPRSPSRIDGARLRSCCPW
jgi:hypothetical protein